jgi:putative heme-binding domain-containing protein
MQDSTRNAGERCVFAYFTLQSQQRQKALLSIDWAGRVNARLAGRVVLFPDPKRPRQAILDLQAGTNDLVLELFAGSSQADSMAVVCTAAGGLSAELPEQLTGVLLAERLRAAASGGSGTAVPRELAEADWPAEVRRGDKVQGRRLFATLGCVKCHAISPEQAGGGAPSLADARRRFNTAHLVESILLPSKQVAEPFRSSTLVLGDGRILSGLVVSESAESVELLQADGSRRVLRPSEIEERSRTAQSPMSPGLVKTVAELRDLLAYLTSERPLPP